ncbi:hypothetical protein G6F20_003036 [Rhizopus arrhizus]|nr:hypothetical protein G6F20_003036 [Rhizopus arrhizus]
MGEKTNINIKFDRLRSLCIAEIIKRDQVNTIDHFIKLVKELQKFPGKRCRDPGYSKRLSDCLRDAKRDYYKTSRIIRKEENEVALKIVNNLAAPVEDLFNYTQSIYNDIVSEKIPAQILCNKQLEEINQGAVHLEESKLDKKDFESWAQTLLDSAHETRMQVQAIRDSTDYDYYVRVLQEQWEAAKPFHHPEMRRTEIAEDTLAHLLNLPSRQEKAQKKKEVESLLMSTLQSYLKDAVDDYGFKHIKNYSQLKNNMILCQEQGSVWEDDDSSKVLKKRKIITEDNRRRINKILKEVDEIIVPARKQGELFCEKYLEKLSVELDHVNDIMQKHSEIIKTLANPDNKDSLEKNGIDTFPTVISYNDENSCLSTALAAWVTRYTKSYVSEIEEQINQIRDQINNDDNKS